MARINVVVEAAAPIGEGQEVEILVVNNGYALVRDLGTRVLYARGSHLESCDDFYVHHGPSDSFRHPRLAKNIQLEKTLRGRVVSCVVANVRQGSGEYEMATSFVIDTDDATDRPYRS